MSFTTALPHHDLLDELNRKHSVSDKIAFLHRVIINTCPYVHRIGVAIYDPASDMLKTFAHSTQGDNPLRNYQCRLSEVKSLKQIADDGLPRVVNDLVPLAGRQEHTRRIRSAGFRASYTIPIYHNEQLTGFVFFNSRHQDVFHEHRLAYLDTMARLISLLVSVELQQVQTLYGALKMATSFSGHKDPETGAHLERMARFSRLIAQGVAAEYGLSDEFVEAIFWFAPMHDVGKIAIPDHIMRKPGKLSDDEFEIMKTHATRGREIIRGMLGNFNLDASGMGEMIGNIAEFHHENIDGSGYPQGLKGAQIPVEARIIAVADVFDALTSERCYKPAWSNEAAFAALREMTAWKLDPVCVDALCRCPEKIREIQTRFRDEPEVPRTFDVPAPAGYGHDHRLVSVLDAMI